MKFKFEIKDLFKLPNILCYLRILMVPLFLHVYFTAETPHDYYLATLIVLASGITDFLDGQIARRCNMITDLGKVIDPVADKLMQLAMLVALMFRVPYMYLLVIYLNIRLNSSRTISSSPRPAASRASCTWPPRTAVPLLRTTG